MTYRISNTNSSKTSFVRVYNDNNEMIAEQVINKRNPLGYIRGVVNSKHKRELRNKCLAGGMSHEEFTAEFGPVKY